ncbi:MAG: sensor histidine kinase [Bacteriovoracia bacterium]
MSRILTDFDHAFRRLMRRYLLSATLLLFASIGTSVIWNRSIKQELADQATLSIRRNLQAGDTRGELQVLSGIRFNAFQSLTQYDRQGRRIVTLPPTVAPIEYKDRSLWDQIFLGEVRSAIRFDDEKETPIGEVSFIYSRFELAGYAALAWFALVALVAMTFSGAKTKLRKEMEKEIAVQNAKVLKDLVGKVRHNIRAPLAVLNAYFTASTEESAALKSQGHRAAGRIEEILAEMEDERGVQARPEEQKPVAIFDAVALARQIVEEKSLFQSRVRLTIKSNGPCAFSRIDGAELKATFSNLLDNALQAVGENGQILLEIESDGHLVAASIQDNGKGIAPELLSKVREKGFSSGKENGSGLGLYYAEKLMDDAKGSLTIESALGQGTKITLLFPQVPTPIWFCNGLAVPPKGTLYICDDQEYILQAWKLKLPENLLKRVKLCAATELLPEAVDPSDRFLIDYDFGKGKRTGLEAIRELPSPAHAVLVTGMAFEASVQAECAVVGCKLLSKDLLASFPVTTA